MDLTSQNSDDEPILIADYDYDLPPELIAQTPIEPRDRSRMLVLDRSRTELEHRTFRDIIDYLQSDDLLVVNDSRVIPARLHGWRPTGGQAEVLLLRPLGEGRWEALVRPGRRLPPGAEILLANNNGERSQERVVVVERRPEGSAIIRLSDAVAARLGDFGEMPLPPYIHERLTDTERYQTVYSRIEGSAAAPTAGLHFTPDLLATILDEGIRIAEVTLHVGIGTFQPVKVADVRQHEMHAEWFHVPPDTLAAIADTRKRSGRVIAIGTTSCRTLESLNVNRSSGDGQSGWTSLFITPGYQFKTVDALVTNFHLPRSTLMLMVSAFAGRERILATYAEAVANRYRFFSFGDAMLIL